MRIYLAGPLFSEAERSFNLRTAQSLEQAGHKVYLPQRDSHKAAGGDRTGGLFRQNVAALKQANVVVAICDGAQVDDGTAWEIGFAYGNGIHVYGLRTDTRIVQQADEPINLMILKSVQALTSSAEDLLTRLNSEASTRACSD